jgi:hypothetical protein
VTDESLIGKEPQANGSQAKELSCAECGSTGRSVARQTVLHHVRLELLDQVSEEDYRFCSDPGCTTVYYGNRGMCFLVADLREPVTVKANGSDRPLCYCFGVTEGHLREEIARTGSSTVSSHISRLIKEGMCACEIRNPAGICCLGQINQAVKNLSGESKATTESVYAPMNDCCAR